MLASLQPSSFRGILLRNLVGYRHLSMSGIHGVLAGIWIASPACSFTCPRARHTNKTVTHSSRHCFIVPLVLIKSTMYLQFKCSLLVFPLFTMSQWQMCRTPDWNVILGKIANLLITFIHKKNIYERCQVWLVTTSPFSTYFPELLLEPLHYLPVARASYPIVFTPPRPPRDLLLLIENECEPGFMCVFTLMNVWACTHCAWLTSPSLSLQHLLL